MRIQQWSLFVLCTLLCFFFAAPVNASGAALSLDAQTGADGSVSAELNLSGVDALSGAQFTIAYDSSILTLSETTRGDLPDKGNYVINDSTPGLVHVLWFSSTGEARTLDDAGADGTPLLSLSFTAKESGNAAVALREDGDATLLLIGGNSESIQVSTEQAHDSVRVTAAAGAAAQAGTSDAGGSLNNDFPLYTPAVLLPLPVQSSPTPLPSSVPLPTPAAPAQSAAKENEKIENAQNAQNDASEQEAAAHQESAGEEPAPNDVPASTLIPYDAPALADAAAPAAQGVGAEPELEVIHEEKANTGTFPVWLFALFLLFAAGAFCVWFFFVKGKERGD